MIPQLQQLTDFWTSLKSKACITFKDWEELELKISKIFLSYGDLLKSRDKWEERAKLAEKELKKQKGGKVW